MVVWILTAIVVALITIGKLILQKYSTKQFVKQSVHDCMVEFKTTIHECKADIKVTDDDIIRRQENCAAELHICIHQLTSQVDRMYIMILDIHKSGTDRDREPLEDWPKK